MMKARIGDVKATPLTLYPWGKDPVPIVQEVGWAPGSVWTGAENLEPRSLQPAASHYADYATRPTIQI